MKYFKDNNNNIYAYEEDVADEQIKDGLIPITEEEADTLSNPPKTQSELDAQTETDAKTAVLLALSQITVTTIYGNTFDGDDIARADMSSAILASETLNLTEHNWKLADNTWKIVQLDELKDAHALAIQAKGDILFNL